MSTAEDASSILNLVVELAPEVDVDANGNSGWTDADAAQLAGVLDGGKKKKGDGPDVPLIVGLAVGFAFPMLLIIGGVAYYML